ncbi:hypothetical protein [Thermicanus aegyptius]|uniref:hypothetical protein n=1 Tax=Thermicanus aegyptius TaxID=94009 RepID=UPI00048AFB29|nr:hypothetical protein [Thermicanus aegyptius]
MNLEKMMFFVPNRLFIKHKMMLVSFNIAVIPTDMTVTSMMLHVPLSGASGSSATLLIRPIASGWDESLVRGGYSPPVGGLLRTIPITPHTVEARMDVTSHSHSWRFQSLENHGHKIWYEGTLLFPFRESDPPYLVVATV